MVIANHKDPLEYTLEGEAYDAFRSAHDKLVDLKMGTQDEDLQGIYAKARGYTARLAMVLDVLEQAVAMVVNTGTTSITWRSAVTPSSVSAAAAILCHLNEQKEIMMGVKGGKCDYVYIYLTYTTRDRNVTLYVDEVCADKDC